MTYIDILGKEESIGQLPDIRKLSEGEFALLEQSGYPVQKHVEKLEALEVGAEQTAAMLNAEAAADDEHEFSYVANKPMVGKVTVVDFDGFVLGEI